MEWVTVQRLDLRHAGGRRRGASARPLQPHAAAFRASQAIVAVAIGTHVIEFDALTGSKIALVDLGARVVRMAYSPTASHVIIAILEDATIRSCDFTTEQTLVLHSPKKKTDHVSINTEVHLALTPLERVVFLGFHKRMSVTVVGTVEGGRPLTKIKTDLKKPIVNLACHPRLPMLYVAYAEGLVRAYNVHTYAVNYTLQLPVDSTIKLTGAGAFGFHPTLAWIFIGDRGGSLLAWDVSTERPNMIGITQAGSQPITSVSWLPTLQLLVTISKDGALQVWKTRVLSNNNRQPMETHFIERAAIETMDITKILTLQGGEAAYPLPRIKNLAVHPKFNLAAVIFADMSGIEAAKNKAAYTREGRRQLFAVLQGARGSTAACELNISRIQRAASQTSTPLVDPTSQASPQHVGSSPVPAPQAAPELVSQTSPPRGGSSRPPTPLALPEASGSGPKSAGTESANILGFDFSDLDFDLNLEDLLTPLDDPFAPTSKVPEPSATKADDLPAKIARFKDLLRLSALFFEHTDEAKSLIEQLGKDLPPSVRHSLTNVMSWVGQKDVVLSASQRKTQRKIRKANQAKLDALIADSCMQKLALEDLVTACNAAKQPIRDLRQEAQDLNTKLAAVERSLQSSMDAYSKLAVDVVRQRDLTVALAREAQELAVKVNADKPLLAGAEADDSLLSEAEQVLAGALSHLENM